MTDGGGHDQPRGAHQAAGLRIVGGGRQAGRRPRAFLAPGGSWRSTSEAEPDNDRTIPRRK